MILVPKEDSFSSDTLYSKPRTTISSTKHESASPIKSKRKVFDMKSNLIQSKKNFEYMDFLASTNNLKDPHLNSNNDYNSNINMDNEKIFKFKNNNYTFSYDNDDRKNNLKNFESLNKATNLKEQEHMHLNTNFHADFFISSNEKKNLGTEKSFKPKKNDDFKNELKNREILNSERVFGFNTENTSNFGFAIPEEDEFEEEEEEIEGRRNREKEAAEEIDGGRGRKYDFLIIFHLGIAALINSN